MELQNKVALITGGRRIGVTLAADLARHGVDVGLSYHRSAVEMEAAALYAMAQARQKSIVCLAHVTNQMARSEGDFEKGVANGSQDALHVVSLISQTWERRQRAETD